MKFRLVEAERAEHSVSLLCGVLGVTRAGFYAWRSREPSKRELRDRELERVIGQVFRDSRETYGAPRVHAELQDEHGLRVSRKRVARLMRSLGIKGVSRRGRRRLPARAAAETPAAPDLVKRDFRAPGRDRLWVADIKYVPTWEGFLFLACVVDAWSRLRASSPPWKPSSSTGIPSTPETRRGSSSSTTWRASTTRAAATRRSASRARSATSRKRVKNERRSGRLLLSKRQLSTETG